MPLQTIQSDLKVNGHLSATSMTIPAGAIDNNDVAADAAIETTKLLHQHQKTYSQPNTTATAETRIVHVARGSGSVEAFEAGTIAIAVGAATFTADLKKNGTTVLSAVITLDSGNVARVVEQATISVPAYVAGDVFEIVTTATAGGGTIATGAFMSATFRESAE